MKMEEITMELRSTIEAMRVMMTKKPMELRV
jgi:hypothetical protein